MEQGKNRYRQAVILFKPPLLTGGRLNENVIAAGDNIAALTYAVFLLLFRSVIITGSMCCRFLLIKSCIILSFII